MDGNRGARRRRIAERGSDRLALITGQIRTLSSDGDPDLFDVDSHSGSTAPCPPSVSQAQSPSSAPSQTLDFPQSEDKAPGSLPPDHDSFSDTSQQFTGEDGVVPFTHDSVSETSQQFTGADGVVPFIRKCEGPPLVLDGKGPSVEVPSEAQNRRVSSSNKVQRLEPLAYLRSIIPFDEVMSAISASERTRALCSVAVAIVVVLAYMGFPILGSRFIKSVIFFRPLYLLLLTNITMVVARVLEKQGGLQRPELQSTGTPSDGEHDFADQLGAALDLGAFALNVTRALFMDCTFYAITLICGLSLAQSLGW